MHTQPLYRYLALAALMGFWSCASTQQTARNAGEVDDLYASSASAQVYADNSSDVSTVAERPSRQQQRFERQQASRNRNPEYNDEQQNYDANSDEYYSELSARKLNRGLSPDPGWNDDGTNAYTSGFANGYNSAMTSAYSWNRWGFNNFGFSNGFNLGLGLGAFGGWGSPWGFNRFGWGGFNDPFYSPFGMGGFAYSPFYSPFGMGGFYDPFWGSPWGFNQFGWGSGFYGGGWGRPVIVNNFVTGADPYRTNRSYGPRGVSASNRYNDGFVNTPRATNGGGRVGSYTGSGNAPAYSNNSPTNSNNGYYAAPRRNSRGSYYYDNGPTNGGRTGSNSSGSYTNPSYNGNSRSSSDYYVTPRQNSRGSYSPPSNSGYSGGYSSGGRGSYSQPSYQQSQPSYSAPQRSYSQPSTPTYSAPSYSGGSRGGGGSSGGGGYSGGGGGSRGPR